ncbi:mitogen-activated protein kinase kinase kinase A-like [Pyrus ussuriensis x Pyrus communis]|uniref:Mitogen-activated protein kinase kinase kinase A-like n=1 Tax=Pyrus ussuriensis x Pyrus communis TaxID=2448454 RepID=A0A5N5FW08_9ROSA|nr:mitogen-activated protein kinase kinase kinase A-like [Pyrus ussuriensis x Pyrus communis]
MSSNSQHSHDTVSWVRGKCIGRGSFGTVSIGVSKPDGRVFAVKSVDQAACLPGQLEALENEIRILRSLSSPNVVSYLCDDVSCEPGNGSATSFRNLHLEYLPGGTAVDAEVDETTLRSRVWCVVAALRDVHSKGIVHCDVKGKNVLVGPAINQAKLADFGSAIILSEDTCTARITPRGSPLWMAPEVINGKYQGPESDVWSLGCTVIEMVTGKPAWEDRGLEMLARIGVSDGLPRFPSRLSETGRDFLDKCLRRDPKERWSCDQLLQHPFLASLSPNGVAADSSPRCVLDWPNSEFGDQNDDVEDDEDDEEYEVSATNRIGKLATMGGTNWESDGWTVVRNYSGGGSSCEEEGTSGGEYLDCGGVKLEIESFSGGGSVERGVNYCGWCAVGASGSKREYMAVERVEIRATDRQSLSNLCRSRLLLFLYYLGIFLNKLRILFICYILYISLSWHGACC